MLFNSLTFLVFFAVVLGLHAALRGWTARKRLLLAASYVFYAAWNPPYVAILAASTVVDWVLARRLDAASSPRARKGLLILSLVANLGLLGFFKYGGFLLENFRHACRLAGIEYSPPEWDIVLPVGISFYTFASLSYTIDVYRREIRPTASLADYALFVSFFPHLVAGPIVRASLLLPQLEVPRRPTADQLGWGLCLLLAGVFQKAVLADALFAPAADAVFAQPAGFGAVDTATGVLAFSGQIFYDFAGYSLAAIGLALCFGFEFPDNFRQPYAARGFSDFWRRWHISLSSWLRDYLYIPLGGNRGSRPRVAASLILTMLIGGLWHGASWMFVLWGALHGLFLAAERAWARPDPGTAASLPLRTALTFLLVSLAWIPFRAPDGGTALEILQGFGRATGALQLEPVHRSLCLAGVAAMLAWHWLTRDAVRIPDFGGWRPLAQAATVAAALLGIFLVSGGDSRAFIYFQF